MQLAEHSHEIIAEGSSRRSRRPELPPNDPTLQFLPVLRRGPPHMLWPFTFFHRIPIAFVAGAQPLFLLYEPPRIGLQVNICNLRERGLLALRAGIDAETRRNCFR